MEGFVFSENLPCLIFTYYVLSWKLKNKVQLASSITQYRWKVVPDVNIVLVIIITIDFLIPFYFSYTIMFLHVFISFTCNWCHLDPRTTVKTSMTLLIFHISSCEQYRSLVDTLSDKNVVQHKKWGPMVLLSFPQFILGLKKLETRMRKQHFSFLLLSAHITMSSSRLLS